MAKIVTFGELMLRLAPPGYLRFSQADRFEASFGGAEANVAVSLSRFGWDAKFVTKLPTHAIGDMAVAALMKHGVDVSGIVRGGERVGIYFLEKGAGARASVCVYDRKYSAISAAEPCEFDWDSIFDGADRFHFTGITPALGENMVAACGDACRAAKERGVKISCDLNFRAKLWTLGEAARVMGELLPRCDLLISNASLARGMFYGGEEDENLPQDELEKLAKDLAERFGLEAVAFTQRKSESASRHRFSGMVYAGGECAFSREHEPEIVDRVGGGDAFAAGVIYALGEGYPAAKAAEFAAAAGALAHTIEGDFNLASLGEVTRLAEGDGAAAIRR